MAGGGALIDLGVHALDLALWLMDFPVVKTVSGSVRAVFGPHQRKMWRRVGLHNITRMWPEGDHYGFTTVARNLF